MLEKFKAKSKSSKTNFYLKALFIGIVAELSANTIVSFISDGNFKGALLRIIIDCISIITINTIWDHCDKQAC